MNEPQTTPTEDVLDIAIAGQDLKEFVVQAWHVLEPGKVFLDNWHIDAICEHLQAVTNGEIKRLLISVPPRHLKSIIVSVMWPAWMWVEHPEFRWFFASYDQALSTRDSVACRMLIQSNWYQRRWGDRFDITTDQNEKKNFVNTKKGHRLSTSVEGRGTGHGGDGVVCDDGHNVLEVESDVKREKAITWWREVIPTRLDNPKTGFKVMLAQRTHPLDLSNYVLQAKEEGRYVHLCLPARYDKKISVTSLSIKDPRKIEGEPLHPNRYGDKELTELENELGPYAWAAQAMQNPTPRKGGIFKADKFTIVDSINMGTIIRGVRYWDKAGTQDGGCFTSGLLMYVMQNKRIIIADVIHDQWAKDIREPLIKLTAENDGSDVVTYVEQEGNSGGKESAIYTIQNLVGHRVKADRPTGDKVTRSYPLADQVEIGNVYLLKGHWNDAFIQECRGFPKGKYKDMVDSATGAFNKLCGKRKRAGVFGMGN